MVKLPPPYTIKEYFTPILLGLKVCIDNDNQLNHDISAKYLLKKAQFCIMRFLLQSLNLSPPPLSRYVYSPHNLSRNLSSKCSSTFMNFMLP